MTFKDIESLEKGLQSFMMYVHGSQTKQVRLSIMRCKNMFRRMDKSKHYTKVSKKESLPIPCAYRDIKFNVIVSKDNIALVGEVQFLLKSMLESKRKDHEFYEIKRRQHFVQQCRRMYLLHSFDYEVMIAGGTSSMLAPLVVDYPLAFNDDFLTKKETHTGGTFVIKMARSQEIKPQLVKYILQKGSKKIWLQTDDRKKCVTVLWFITCKFIYLCILLISSVLRVSYN